MALHSNPFNKDGTPFKGHKGGHNGGLPKGTELPTRNTYDPDQLAEAILTKATTGQDLFIKGNHRPLTEDDRKLIGRIASESIDAFNARLSDKLALIADKLSHKIEEAVDQNRFKPGELGFIFSVVHDKRLTLDGRSALQNASINVQINNFGQLPKKDLLDQLEGLPKVCPPP